MSRPARRDDGPEELERKKRLDEAFAGTLPEGTGDETDEAWGDRGDRTGARDEAWFRSQVPPHHG